MSGDYVPENDMREKSRRKWSSAEASFEALNCGSLLRIADAMEVMAKDRVQMEASLKFYMESCERYQATVARLRKSNAALRGCLRRAKNNAVRP